MAYDLYTFAPRGPVLTNSSANPFLVPVGGVGRGAANGRLAGIHNESTLHHLKLPLAAGAGLPKFRHVVLELLPGGRSYRVWNSEGWSHGALRGEGDAGMFRRSPARLAAAPSRVFSRRVRAGILRPTPRRMPTTTRVLSSPPRPTYHSLSRSTRTRGPIAPLA